MASFAQQIEEVVQKADVVLFVVDAREVQTSTNGFLDTLLRKYPEKKLLYVINKIDLVEEKTWKYLRKMLRPSVAVSAREHMGTMMLLRRINSIMHGEEAVIAVVGYPNTGKSSIINAMKGRGSTSTSPVAGHTRAIQKIRVSSKLVLLDAPGILPREDILDPHKQGTLAIVGTVDIARIKEPDLLAMRLLKEQPHLSLAYGVDEALKPEPKLEEIARVKNLLMPGGKPDVQRAARMLLEDNQRGKLTPR